MTKRLRAKEKSIPQQWLWPLLTAILAIGLLLSGGLWKTADHTLRAELLNQAQLLTKTVDTPTFQHLTGTPADLDTPFYNQSKEHLDQTKQMNEDFRFIYLMGRRTDGTVFFFVDSEPAGSADESLPGDIYEEISDEYLTVFNQQKPLTVGPVTDRWGTWVTALAPLIDPQTNQILSVLGIDVDATHWKMNILERIALPLGLTLSLLVILMAVVVIYLGKPQESAQPTLRRLLIPLSLFFILISALFVGGQLRQQRADLKRTSQAQLKQTITTLEKALESQTATFKVIEEAILSNPDLRKALKEGNRAQLQATWEPIYQNMNTSYGLTHFYFHTADGVNLLRVHKPDQYGDVIDRHTLHEAERTGSNSSGIELGPLGTFTLRSVHPIYYEYNLIGYLELGKEIVDILVNRYMDPEIEVAIHIHKNNLDQAQWETGMAMLGRDANWERYPDSVQIFSSYAPAFKKNLTLPMETITGKKGDCTDITLDKITWKAIAHPLNDAAGAEVGNLIILLNTSKGKQAVTRSLGTTLPLILFILIALIGAIYTVLHRTDTAIQSQHEALLASKNQLQINDQRWNLAQQVTQIGNWELNLITNTFWASEQAFKIFGIPLDKATNPKQQVSFNTILSCIKTQKEEEQALRDLIVNNVPYDRKYELIRPDNSAKQIVQSIAMRETNRNGTPSKITGTIQDITERAAQLNLMTNLAKIDTAIQKSANIEQMMTLVLQETLNIFKADRALLLFPCDPTAPSWNITMIQTTPKFALDNVIGHEIKMHPAEKRTLQAMLDVDGPIGDQDHPDILSDYQRTQFSIHAQIMMALYPQTGKPWALSVQQCTEKHIWTPAEKILMNEIGHRLSNALSTLILLRNLHQNEALLKENNQRWNAAQNATKTGNWELDLISGKIWGSEEAFNICGIPLDKQENPEQHMPYLEATDYILDPGPVLRANENIAKTKEPYDLEFKTRPDNHSASRTVRSIAAAESDANGNTIKIIGTVQDITKRKESEKEIQILERQIQHGQKLESLGVLAGGIAHDFNNILMAVLGYADLAIADLDETHPALPSLYEIEKGAKRAAELTRQMLAYSGRGHFVVESINVSTLMNEMAHLLRASIPNTITLNYKLDKNLLPIHADTTQIQQIVMNLITNAAESISSESGTMNLTTGQMTCTKKYLSKTLLPHSPSEPPPPPGTYIYLEVSDTGCGMNKETQEKIFDPFFTTKFTGRGLGMAAVLGIIKGHSGAIMLETALHKGSTFRVLLPAHIKPATAKTPDTKKADRTNQRGSVLIVDDEEMVRTLTSKMLVRQGFSTRAAKDGIEGVEIFRKHATEIDWVILDLTMPNMDGEACFEALKEIDPNVKAIMASGYSESELNQRFAERGLAGFIQKPFTMAALVEKLHTDPS